ncbi:MAG TPA: helix-turn-helix transcriptional regulator [Dongiaceae bacterium]|nr:helix-turn-helix transcriptional regulator [Dongiaceae bacterium]
MVPAKHNPIGPRLARTRRELGMSQKALAVAAGISRDAVARLERGDRIARVDTLMALAQALGVSVGNLLGEDSADERLARLGALLRDADEDTYSVVTAVARELHRLNSKRRPGP